MGIIIIIVNGNAVMISSAWSRMELNGSVHFDGYPSSMNVTNQSVYNIYVSIHWYQKHFFFNLPYKYSASNHHREKNFFFSEKCTSSFQCLHEKSVFFFLEWRKKKFPVIWNSRCNWQMFWTTSTQKCWQIFLISKFVIICYRSQTMSILIRASTAGNRTHKQTSKRTFCMSFES